MNKIFILAFILFGVQACKNNETKFTKSYTDSTIHLRIAFPNNWQFDSSTYKILEDIAGDKDLFQESIVMGAEPLDSLISLKEYATSIKTTYKILDSNFKESNFLATKVNNLDAYELLFTTSKNNLNYKNQTLIFKQKGLGYFIQFNALDSTFAAHQATFNAIKNQISTF